MKSAMEAALSTVKRGPRGNPIDETLEQRLLRNCIAKGCEECWVWTGWHDKNGYGVVRFYWKVMRAHRAAYKCWAGDIPRGLWVLHDCDNPGCINPDHLWLGTAADNARDREMRGRSPNSGWNGRGSPRDAHGRFAKR